MAGAPAKQILQIDAATRLPRRAAEDRLEEVREQVTGVAAVFHPEAARRAGYPLRPVEPTRLPARLLPLLVAPPQAVVLGALLRVAQHFVGFVDLFKFRLGFWCRVHIRVIFARQMPERLLDVLLAGIARHP